MSKHEHRHRPRLLRHQDKALFFPSRYRNDKDNNLYLTAASMTSGNNVYWAARDESKAQRWKLIEVTGGEPETPVGGDSPLVTKFIPASESNYTKDRAAQGGAISEITIHHCAGAPDWPVSDESLATLKRLVADIAKRNGLGKLVRGVNLTWHQMYAATACPGPYLLGKIDEIVQDANAINGY